MRVLNIKDDSNRECLLTKESLSFSAEGLARELNQVEETYGYPEFMRTDNGPDFSSKANETCCRENNITRIYSELGRPMQK